MNGSGQRGLRHQDSKILHKFFVFCAQASNYVHSQLFKVNQVAPRTLLGSVLEILGSYARLAATPENIQLHEPKSVGWVAPIGRRRLLISTCPPA